ncbi:putative Heat shock protein 70 family [Helianthus annuus]|nr:putative Heat shock protein 70 family [Helianthus annuus]
MNSTSGTISEGPRGGILIELEYLKNKWSFTPVEILGMLFKHLKQIAEKNLDSGVVDYVIGIPSYFTDLQRRLYLDAAHIAGLTPLSLLHDGTAIALGYGMYKTDFSNSGPTTNVMFVDIGHCDTQVTVAACEQGEMKVLCHSSDQNLGGRDFDEVLFKHFAAQFNEKYKIDVYSNASAFVRLRTSCEKVKKVLSANAEAPLSIECLIGDTDVRGIITRDEFESLSSKLLERVTVPCTRWVWVPYTSYNEKVNFVFEERTDKNTNSYNDELHEAREKENMLAEQDIKGQRNALVFFIHDTRFKLCGTYKSFVTDTEKEEITNNLQITENWLNEDSDDESEHDHAGTLKDLKRLLEPIENRYMEETAIAKATKALQTCIAKYHARADSLPSDKKQKV